MTLSGGNSRRERGKAYKQARLDRQDRQNARFPWLIPTIAILAVVIVVTGLIFAVALGHLF